MSGDPSAHDACLRRAHRCLLCAVLLHMMPACDAWRCLLSAILREPGSRLSKDASPTSSKISAAPPFPRIAWPCARNCVIYSADSQACTNHGEFCLGVLTELNSFMRRTNDVGFCLVARLLRSVGGPTATTDVTVLSKAAHAVACSRTSFGCHSARVSSSVVIW